MCKCILKNLELNLKGILTIYKPIKIYSLDYSMHYDVSSTKNHIRLNIITC